MKRIVPSLIVILVAVGCAKNKPAPSAVPPMNAAALNIPAAPPAPAAQYTPPPQPVISDAPADQPVIEDATADASDSPAAPASPRPRKASAAGRGGARYTVKKGESLWSIAQSRYGNGNKWKQIAAANPRINPDRVQAGQTIVLP